MVSLGAPVAAIRFLTRIPLPGAESRATDLRHLASWFPMVGLIVGIGAVATDVATRTLSQEVRSALILAVMVAITGALHLDALMDAADGLTAPGSLQRLDLMRSSVHTGLGLLIGFTLLLVAWQAINELGESRRAAFLLATPIIGRMSIVALYRLAPLHPESGFITRELKLSSERASAMVSIGIGSIVTTVALGPGLACVVLSLSTALIVGMSLLARSWDGFSGDQFGAVGVLSETLALIVGSQLVMGIS